MRLDLDQTLPPDIQAGAQARTGAAAVHIEAGHMVMVSQPERLAQLLNDLDRSSRPANSS